MMTFTKNGNSRSATAFCTTVTEDGPQSHTVIHGATGIQDALDSRTSQMAALLSMLEYQQAEADPSADAIVLSLLGLAKGLAEEIQLLTGLVLEHHVQKPVRRVA